MLPRNQDRFELTERQEDVASLWQLAEDGVLDGAPLLVLIGLAKSGYENYAYQSGGPRGAWCLWIDCLAEERPDHNGRVPVSEWREHVDELLHEMGYPLPGAPESEGQP